MPSTATEALRVFIEARRPGGLSRDDVADAQLQRARLLARGERVEPVLSEYEALIVNPTRDLFVSQAEGFEDRVNAAAAILRRSPTTRISSEHLLPEESPGPWRFRVKESLADGLFGVDEARAVLEKKPNKGELVELFMSVAGKTSYASKAVMLEAIAGRPPVPRPPAPTPAPAAAAVDLRPTIERLRTHVDSLEGQVARMERENAEKLRTIDSLIFQIEDRKATIRDNYEDNRTAGMLFAIFGAPSAALVSLMAMERDDSRLNDLTRQLNAHRAEQSQLQARLSEYEDLAVPARRVLARLESAARALEPTALSVSDPRLNRAAAPAARLQAGTKLVESLRSQLGVL